MYGWNSTAVRWACGLQDDGSFSLLTDDWGAIEEVLLLDAVEQEGLGNWCTHPLLALLLALCATLA